MTAPLDLAAVKARCERATAGPWVQPHAEHGGQCLVYDKDDGDWTIIARGVLRDDLCFIAHARTDIPALVAEVERLAAENARLRAVRDVAAAFMAGRGLTPMLDLDDALRAAEVGG